MSISEDGKLLAGSKFPKYGETVKQHSVNVWGVDKKIQISSIPVENEVSLTSFSPDKQLIAVAMGKGPAVIELYQIADGKLACKLSGQTGMVTSLTFSEDGTRLFSSALDQTLRAWNVPGCAPEWVVKTGHNIDTISLSKDSLVLASVNKIENSKDNQPTVNEINQKVFLWNAKDGKPINELAGSKTNLTQVALGQDGRIIVSAIWTCNVQIMDEKGTYLRHGMPIHQRSST